MTSQRVCVSAVPRSLSILVRCRAGIRAEIRGVFQRAGVHIKPHRHLDVVTTLVGERSDSQGSIAQAMIVWTGAR